MELFFGISVIFCLLDLVALENGVEVKDLIEHVGVVVDVYSGILDQEPWSQFEQAHEEFRNNPTDRSTDSANLLGGIHTNFLNTIDAYDSLSLDTREWCGLSNGLLPTFNRLFDGLTAEKSQAQKTLLLRVIDSEISKMSDWQRQLTDMATNFHGASDKLTTLNNRALPASSKTFYGTLNSEEVDQAYKNVIETKAKLQTEREVIERLRAQYVDSKPNGSIDEESHKM
ncbi:hypothetical protein HA402_010465 [Bradysia odoriphaga]|nr:hypothetical protein HA402_010465 [Bradysia odoriphaga]